MYYLFWGLGLRCCEGFSLDVESGSYSLSLVALHGLLIAVAYLIAEHRLRHTASVDVARALSSCSSWALAHRL